MSGISGVQQHHQPSRIKCVLSVYRLNAYTEHRQQRTGVLRGADIKVINRRKQDERAAVTPQNNFSAEWKRFSLSTSLQTLLFIIPLTQSTTAINLRQRREVFLYAPTGHEPLDGKRREQVEKLEFENKDSFQAILGVIRPHLSRAAPQHAWQKNARPSRFFNSWCGCFSELLRGVVSESPQRERSTSAGTLGFFLPEIPAESALIITAPPPTPPSEVETERATAGGEELGFKQYRLQEVQPSLLVVDSDINSNEYLGALPDCLSTNRYRTGARALKVGFVCASFVCYWPCLWVHVWPCDAHASVYLYVLVLCWVWACPFCWGQIWVICRTAGSPKMTRADRNN